MPLLKICITLEGFGKPCQQAYPKSLRNYFPRALRLYLAQALLRGTGSNGGPPFVPQAQGPSILAPGSPSQARLRTTARYSRCAAFRHSYSASTAAADVPRTSRAHCASVYRSKYKPQKQTGRAPH
jgi:hypothetical protein